MIGLHFSFHHDAFALFQVGGFAVAEDHFCLSPQAIHCIKGKVVGVVQRVVFNGLGIVDPGNEMNVFALLLFCRINGIVRGEITC